MTETIDYYIRFCKDYSETTMIPTILRNKRIALYSSQGEVMGILPNTSPDAYLYYEETNGLEFCAGHPEIQYARIPINGTTLDVYLGPVFPAGITEEILRNLMHEQIIPLDRRDELEEYITHIPTISRSQLAKHMCLVNRYLNHEEINPADIYGKNDVPVVLEEALLTDDENEIFSKLYHFEQHYYQLVRNGNASSLQHFLANYTGNLKSGRLAGSELRHYKNQFITNATKLTSLAAIPAGVAPREAFNLAHLYIRECEALKTVEEVNSLEYSMIMDFCNLCGNTFLPDNATTELSKCIYFIRNHVNESIGVADVADSIHRSASYTMKLFRNELQITINNFIIRCKLEEAKSLLSYTDMSLAQISNYLCFSSQSYFQNLFKKKYGMTPANYRKKTS